MRDATVANVTPECARSPLTVVLHEELELKWAEESREDWCPETEDSLSSEIRILGIEDIGLLVFSHPLVDLSEFGTNFILVPGFNVVVRFSNSRPFSVIDTHEVTPGLAWNAIVVGDVGSPTDFDSGSRAMGRGQEVRGRFKDDGDGRQSVGGGIRWSRLDGHYGLEP